MQPANILEMLILLMLANGMPVIAKKILDNRFSYQWTPGPLRRRQPAVRPVRDDPGDSPCSTGNGCGRHAYGARLDARCSRGRYAMLGDLFSSFIKRCWA